MPICTGVVTAMRVMGGFCWRILAHLRRARATGTGVDQRQAVIDRHVSVSSALQVRRARLPADVDRSGASLIQINKLAARERRLMLGMRREIAKFPTVSDRQAGGISGLAPIPTRLGPTGLGPTGLGSCITESASIRRRRRAAGDRGGARRRTDLQDREWCAARVAGLTAALGAPAALRHASPVAITRAAFGPVGA